MAYRGCLENSSRATDRGFESYLFRIAEDIFRNDDAFGFFLPKKFCFRGKLYLVIAGFEYNYE